MIPPVRFDVQQENDADRREISFPRQWSTRGWQLRTSLSVETVLDRHDLGAGRHARSDFGDLCLDVGDGRRARSARSAPSSSRGTSPSPFCSRCRAIGRHQPPRAHVANRTERRARLLDVCRRGRRCCAVSAPAAPCIPSPPYSLTRPPPSRFDVPDRLRDLVDRDACSRPAMRVDEHMVFATKPPRLASRPRPMTW